MPEGASWGIRRRPEIRTSPGPCVNIHCEYLRGSFLSWPRRLLLAHREFDADVVSCTPLHAPLPLLLRKIGRLGDTRGPNK